MASFGKAPMGCQTMTKLRSQIFVEQQNFQIRHYAGI